jgi:hypothetical protein
MLRGYLNLRGPKKQEKEKEDIMRILEINHYGVAVGYVGEVSEEFLLKSWV